MARAVHMCVSVALLSSLLGMSFGCSDEAAKRSDGKEEAVDGAAASLDHPAGRVDYVGERLDGQYRLYAVDPDNGKRYLLRVLPTDDPRASQGSPPLADRDAELNRRWRQARSVPQRRGHQTPAEAHDVWLETAERLEACHESDTQHLGVLRDLLSAYSNVLRFERPTTLGTNICRLASRKADLYAQLASPLAPQDRQRLATLRAWLFFVMRAYPLAVEQIARAGDTPRARQLADACAALGQSEFIELEQFEEGPFEVRSYRTSSPCPNEHLLWGQTYFLVAPKETASPHTTLCYVLTRRGEENNRQYALHFRSLNRSRLLVQFGSVAPSYPQIRRRVAEAARRAITPQKEGRSP